MPTESAIHSEQKGNLEQRKERAVGYLKQRNARYQYLQSLYINQVSQQRATIEPYVTLRLEQRAMETLSGVQYLHTNIRIRFNRYTRNLVPGAYEYDTFKSINNEAVFCLYAKSLFIPGCVQGAII